jgi:N4-gp56 family major capsid protein
MGNTIAGGGGATSIVQAYYEKKFLMESRKTLVLKPLGMQGSVPKHAGNTVVWNRFSVPTSKGTALTDAADPTPTGLSAALLSATLNVYGNFERIGELLDTTAVSSVVEKAVDLLAYEAALSIDTVCYAEISAGGVPMYASVVTARNSLNDANVLTVRDIRKAVNKLQKFGARPHTGNRYVAVTHPDVIFDLQGDSDWVNAHIYTEKGVNNIYNGEVGELYGTKFIMTQNAPILTNSGSVGGTTDVYQTHIMGKDFFGVSELYGLKTWVDSPSKNIVMNHASDVAWKTSFAVKTLNDSFGIRMETSSSLGA